MNTIVKTGLILGLACEAWTFLMGFTGWYKDSALLNLFWVVVLIQVGVLIWGLQQTAAQGRTYGGQVGAGTLMSAVAAVVLFLGSLLFTMVVFPNYFQDVAAMQEQMLTDQGRSAEEIATIANAQAPFMTPVVNAITGAVMTVITGCVFSLLIAIFVRSKSPAAATSPTA
jgi:hypothetical protein